MPREGRMYIIRPNFSENFMKMKKIGSGGWGGGTRPKCVYVDAPLLLPNKSVNTTSQT